MNKNKIKASKYGILLTTPTGDTYPVGWWQIEQDGFSHWLCHLHQKRWFTDSMSREFTDLCIEHYNWPRGNWPL